MGTGRPSRANGLDAGAQEVAFSPSAENYLLGLYELQYEATQPLERLAPSRLALHLQHFPPGEELGTSLPSVLGMVRRLQRRGLVSIDRQRRIALTSSGRERAEDVARRHHLAECLLVEELGVELPWADREAHRLEHYISAEMQADIQRVLGNPTICPYGRPIPGSGYQERVPSLPLSRAVTGKSYVVARLPEDDPELVEFLMQRDLVPARQLTVSDVAPYRDTVAVQTGRGQATLGYGVAGVIMVQPDDSS